MSNLNFQKQSLQNPEAIHWGHFGLVLAVLVLLLGAAWMKQPDLFAFKKPAQVQYANVPKYYAYVEPAEFRLPLVAGASTNEGPGIINEDGTVAPIDLGEVLGASTEGVELSLGQIHITEVPDSEEAVGKYFAAIQSLENNLIDTAEFENALSSGDQAQINQQVEKFGIVKKTLSEVSVPQSLAKLHKLKIIQYNASTGLLRNFTSADSNPELVGSYLDQFIKSEQDIDTENKIISEKYPAYAW